MALPAICMAALEGNYARISTLLDSKVHPDQRDPARFTALHFSSRRGDVSIVDLLLHHSADTNTQNIDGYTALHWAAMDGRTNVVGTLLASGANKNILNNQGKSPLDLALEKGHEEIAEILAGQQTQIHPPTAEIGDEEDPMGESAIEDSEQTEDQDEFQEIREKLRDNRNLGRILQSGCNFLACTVNLAGAARAGKTCVNMSIRGIDFSETPSTVGTTKHTVSTQQVTTGGHVWGNVDADQSQEEEGIARTLAASLPQNSDDPPPPVGNLTDFSYNEAPDAISEPTHEYSSVEFSSVAVAAASHRGQIVNDEISLRVNEALVLKYVKESGEGSEPLRLTLMDFGGQKVFLSMHGMFMKRRSVFVLVFNMEWLLPDGDASKRDETFEMLDFWFKSVSLHARDPKDDSCAPVFLVGTHKDIVSDLRAHENISKLLYDRFGSQPNLKHFSSARVSTGRGNLWFYPVDNTLGLKDTVITNLMQDIEQHVRGEDFVKQKVPLSWLKVCDRVARDTRKSMHLNDFESLCSECGVKSTDVQPLLCVLTEIGTVMYNPEPSLRNIVVTNPVEFIVGAVSKFVCEFTIHIIPEHQQAKKHRAEWQRLTQHGILSTKLLPILWGSDLYRPHILELQHLICKFGLMIPLVSDDDVAVEHQEYLVPAILTQLNSTIPPAISSDSSLACWMVFAPRSVASEWRRVGAMSTKDVALDGFLPHGVFPRVVGIAVSQCQRFCGERMDPSLLELSGSWASGLTFGDHRFSLREFLTENTIEVQIHVQNTLVVMETLSSLVSTMLQTSMPELEMLFAVRTPDRAHYCLIFGEHGLQNRVSQDRPPPQLLQSALAIAKQSLSEMFRPWLPPRGLLPHYHVFISYRWNSFDTELADALFYDLSRKVVHEAQVQVFLDRQRLESGSNFVTDFMEAMLSSTVVAPLVSIKALERMVRITGGEDAADNVLLEWTLLLELHRQKRLAAVQPILIGDLSEDKPEMSVLFSSESLSSLPETVSLIAVKLISNFVRSKGMSPTSELSTLTVKQTVRGITTFLGTTLWDVKSSHGGGVSAAATISVGVSSTMYKTKLFRVAATDVMKAVNLHTRPTEDSVTKSTGEVPDEIKGAVVEIIGDSEGQGVTAVVAETGKEEVSKKEEGVGEDIREKESGEGKEIVKTEPLVAPTQSIPAARPLPQPAEEETSKKSNACLIL